MDYGYAALELMLISIEAERALAHERYRWLREYERTIGRGETAATRRLSLAAAVRMLAGADRGRLRPARKITRVVRRVAGTIRAIGAAE